MPPTRIWTVAPCGKLKVTSCPRCTFDAVASVESTMAVFVEVIADAVTDTMLSDRTLPRLDGSIAATLCELPPMITEVARTSVTSRKAWVLLQRRRRLGVEVRPLREHDELRPQCAFDRVVGGDADRVGEDRDACHERKPDHQRRGSERCAPGIPPRVLTGENTGRTAQAAPPASRARWPRAPRVSEQAARHRGRRRGSPRRSAAA